MKIVIDKKNMSKIKKRVSLHSEVSQFKLPIYSSQIFNIISGTGQATRPKYVGQMSEIVPAFIEKFWKENSRFPNWEDWREYYSKNHKDEYLKGYEILKEYISKYKDALILVANDENEFSKIWYDKFIFFQNFAGFNYEFMIREKISDFYDLKKNKKVIIKSTPDLESKNIDFIIRNESGKDLPITVKPTSFFMALEKYKIKDGIIMVTYETNSDGELIINIDNDDSKKIEEF